MATLNLQRVHRINIGSDTKHRIQSVLDTIYDDSVGLNLKSKRFIRQMAKWEQKLKNNQSGDWQVQADFLSLDTYLNILRSDDKD